MKSFQKYPRLRPEATRGSSIVIASLVCMFLLGLSAPVQAQSSITSMDTVYESVSDNSDNYTHDGRSYNFNVGSDNMLLILSAAAGGRTYVPAKYANRIEMQRVEIEGIPNEREIFFYEGLLTETSVDLSPSFLATMEEVLLNPVLNRGVDNIFQNAGDGNGNVNNVMRLDFIFDDGILIPAGADEEGFLVNERGGNDAIKIAAITSLDANGNPASFGPVVSAEHTDWGPAGFDLKTQVLRKPDQASNAGQTANLNPQPMTGIVFTFQDLGLMQGDTIYGYALAAGDAPESSSDWLDVSTFPTDTIAPEGGLDLIAGGAYFSSNPVIVAEDDTFSTPFATDLEADVAPNDTFESGSQFEVESPPLSGSLVLNNDGSFTYTPDASFEGTDEFTYTVCLPAPIDYICDTAVASIQVGGAGSGIVNYFPAGGPGTLAYEDLWPSKGDFDFNDMVIDYQFKVTSNDENIVEQVEANFELRAFGAGFRNGFGFQLSEAVQNSDISVSGSSLSESYITLSGNGTEADQSQPTIIVFDNAYNEMQHPGSGTGVNTTPGAPYVTPASFTITIDFTGGSYTFADLELAAFKPFIMVDRERGREVHLPGNEPTDLADMSYFGTRDDASDAGQQRWYVSDNNLPWAINIIESFEYPTEKTQISEAYLRFTDWAQSGGVSYTDWYSNPGGSYRDNSKIYDEDE